MDDSPSQASAKVFRVTLLTPRGEHAIVVGGEQHIWEAALAAGITLPALCHQGRCLTCAAKLVQWEVDQSAADAYFPQDRAEGFVLLCTARPRSDLILETHEQSAMRKHRTAHGLPAPYT